MRQINILLVNEFRLMINVIAAALEDEPDINVVGCVTNVEDALELVRARDVDVALVSTRLPDQKSLELIRSITEIAPATKVLALGLIEEKETVLRFVEAGATGYILKDDSLDDLIESVRAAVDDEVYVSPRIAAAMMERLSDLARIFSNIENSITDDVGLTIRERQVLELISQGLTNQQISEQLVIEVGTVKNHVHSILEKLNVGSRREAASYVAFIKQQTPTPTSSESSRL